MPEIQPIWKATYPVRQSAEHDVSRRQFVKAACCTAAAVGIGWFLKDRLFPVPAGTEPLLVAKTDELPVGGSKLFSYPTKDHPAILVRLSETAYAAYSQSCTHLQCPVHYRHEDKQFFCPCHQGFFSAEDGRVLAGPPPRPLPRHPVEIRGNEIWIVPKATVT